MRVLVSDNNRHPFIAAKRPTILTRKGSQIYIDCVETSPGEVALLSQKIGVQSRVLCWRIGDEIIKRLEGVHLDRELDQLDTFVETIQLEFIDQRVDVNVHLRIVIENLSCFLKVVVAL